MFSTPPSNDKSAKKTAIYVLLFIYSYTINYILFIVVYSPAVSCAQRDINWAKLAIVGARDLESE